MDASILRRMSLALCSLLLMMTLAACGGGGGGGGGDGGGGSNTGGGGGSGKGAFSLARTSVSFTARASRAAPPVETIALTVTGSDVAAVGAAYPASQGIPPWLYVNIVGNAPNFTVQIGVRDTMPPLGKRSAVLLVGTADSGGNVLQSREIAISYELLAGIRLSATTSPTSYAFGLAPATQAIDVAVTAENSSWTLESNAAWLVAPSGTQTGSKQLQLAADLDSLGPGVHRATLTLSNTADPSDFEKRDVEFSLVTPDFTVNPATVTLGAADGLGDFSQAVTAYLTPGVTGYPVTLQLSDTQSLGWLTATPLTVPSGSNAYTTTLGVDFSRVSVGSFTGSAVLSVAIKGRQFSKTIPVTLNVERQRLFATPNGVALSKFPTRAGTLSRTITIRTSHGREGLPWTAQSNQPWLSVTPSGLTGQTLTLTANPSSVAADTSHVAVVTLSSTDPALQGTETIRVGLWKGSADPVNTSITVDAGLGLAVNPVEPYVYVPSDAVSGTSKSIAVYNVYTGALVTTFSNIGDHLTGMEVVSDGSLVFVVDRTPRDMIGLNATTGVEVSRFHTPDGTFSTNTGWDGLFYSRPNAEPILQTPFLGFYRLSDGKALEVANEGYAGSFTLPSEYKQGSVDSRYVYSMEVNSSQNGVGKFRQRYSGLDGGKLYFKPEGGIGITNDPGQDFCISEANGQALVSHQFAPIQVIDLQTFTQVTTLPGTPRALACGFQGNVYAGASSASGADLIVYDASGTNIGSTRTDAASNTRVERRMRLSGDGTRVISRYYAMPSQLTLYDVP